MNSPVRADLTRRLFEHCDHLDTRLELSGQLSAPSGIRAVSAVSQADGWQDVRGVILRAARDKRSTLVYGDYDVDGTFSVTMLYRWLRRHQVPGNTFVPSRHLHGYGLDEGIIRQAIEHGYQTLIALDCGSADQHEIELARDAGLDVAVIDHHQPQGRLSVPLLNPHTAPQLPPLCTAGLVAFVLAELDHELPGGLAGDELELAGLATIADMVPLEPVNWALAHAGLECLVGTGNAGIQELIKASGLHGLEQLTARQASFDLIPRLNAAGRMRSPRIVLDLLLAETPDKARQAAGLLERLNRERKDVSRRISRQAILAGSRLTGASGLALYQQHWHVGVLGIVAAQVAGQLDKPTAILADEPEAKAVEGAEPLLTGSVRSAGGVDVMAALAQCADTLYSFGGHAQAAGLKVPACKLAQFQSAWAHAVAAQATGTAEGAGSNVAPVAAQLHELTGQVEDDLWGLQPYGPGFEPAPVLLEGCRLERASLMGREKTHLAVTVTDGQRSARLVGFFQSHLQAKLDRPGMPLRPLISLEPDNYQNRRTIMLRLLGLE